MNRLALVMIVRDEARCLARCLASAQPWVDEMVVLDTGSADASARIAADSGARVERLAWTHDFAAARNAALSFSDAAWNLVLDADEWIDGGAESLAAWRRQPADCIGQVRVTSFFDRAGGAVEEAPSWLPRVLPRGVRYAGRIHEQPDSALPRRRLALRVSHDGYLDRQKATKGDRNERLLRLALAADPADSYMHYQLGKELELCGRFADAAPHYGAALDGCDARAGWRHDLVLRALFTMKKTGRFEAALALAEVEMPHWSGSPDFFFTLGDLLLDWAVARPERGAELLPMIESSWLQALEIGEQPLLQDTVRGRGSFLAAHNLAVLHAGLGAEDEAARWRARAAAMRGERSAAHGSATEANPGSPR